MAIPQNDTNFHDSLHLPEVLRIPFQRRAGYGADAVAAEYCGLRKVPAQMRGVWQHGWNPRFEAMLHPDMIMSQPTSPEEYHWVARKDQEERLRSFRYTKVAAIGLPIVYLPPRAIPRRPGSLLVMPAHTQEFQAHRWKYDEYAELIAAISGDFSELVVCVHIACWKNGYWVDAFRKRGFPVVVGARPDDRNTLERIRYLLSSFEYVTTNGFGSQLAYAAYFGAKPSIFGPYAGLRPEDYKNDPLYQRHPKLIKPTLEALSEEALRRNLPQLFCHPQEAEADVEWGRVEVGELNKVSPRRMRRLFGWTAPARVARSLAARTPGRVKHKARMLLEPSYREQHRETQRLWATPRFQPTRTTLLGRPLEVLDAHRFLEAKAALFNGELYRFATTEASPRIIDCGANVGLVVCYFKQLYPECRIIAFEPDPRAFELLERNCAVWGLRDVELVPKAVWTGETTLPFLLHDAEPGQIVERSSAADVVRVPTCRLRDHLAGAVDLLRLNIEGAEVDVLLDCADLLDRVRNIVVDYHSIFDRPQRLDTLIGLLTQAGYRLDFRATSYSTSPLLYRRVSGGMDSKLRIFAFRDRAFS